MSIDLKYPLDIVAKNRYYLRVSAYEYSMPTLPSRKKSGDVYQGAELKRENKLFTYSTYIPGGFGDSVQAKWEDNDGAIFTGKVDKMTLNDAEKMTGGDITSKMAGQIAALAQAKIAKTVSGASMGGMKGAFEASTGIRFAPNTSKVFQGNSGRQLELATRFAPINSVEGAMVNRIVSCFRNATTSVMSNSLEGMMNIFTYPAIFDISMVRAASGTSVSNGSYITFRSMVCTSFKVSWSDGQEFYTWFNDGTPTEGQMSLSFESIFPAFRNPNTPIDSPQVSPDPVTQTSNGQSDGTRTISNNDVVAERSR